jgi:hypothetical protein
LNTVAYRVLSLLLAVILPLQGMLAMAAQLQGPLHGHLASVEYDEQYQQPNHHGLNAGQHREGHLDKERHFHPHDETGVLIDDDDHHENVAVESGLQKAGSAGLSIALISTRTVLAAPKLRFGANAASLMRFATRYLPRLERPPQSRLS